MIVVSKDAEGLRLAMLEVLGAQLKGPETHGPHPEEGEDSGASGTDELSPGYFVRLKYLLWLERLMRHGAKFELKADEVEGMAAIEEARREFAAEHPACRECGAAQWSRFAKRCRACGVEFGKR